ncbi:hypothetical protein [Nocardia vaccinii]|uniref:hypothetical protein n=1 Tax=Nocardia vaccinii TaxID=1822 RepID=UPI00083138EF|nr:hypothetical protein [Nocardia vaccinii]
MNDIAASDSAMRAAAAAWSRARIYDDKLGDPDTARLAAWAESIERWKLETPDLLEAVNRYYEGCTDGRTIGIGDLLHHAREVRRQRAESEKAAQVHAEVVTAAALPGAPFRVAGDPVWAAYDVNGAIDRECPRCHAAPNDACITARGTAQKMPCVARLTGKSIVQSV